MGDEVWGNAARSAAVAILMLTATAVPMAWPGATQAQTAEQFDFDIASQPLADALVEFGLQSGYQVTVDGATIRDVGSNGAVGAISVGEALNRLLTGTGFTFRIDGNVVTISQQGSRQPGPPQLGTITVEGELEVNPADVPFMTPGSSAYISLEQIERIPPSSPGDIFKEVPGVLSGASNDGTSINVNIRSARGLNRVRTMVEGTQQESSFYQGYAGPDQRTYIDPDLIGGVEISKGPGAGPYGTGTTAGAVNVRLLDADDLVPEGDSFGVRLRGGLAGNGKTPQFLEEVIRRRGADTGLRERDGNDFLTDDNWFGSIAGAYRSDRFELVGAFAKRKEGNYFAGRNGSETFTAFKDTSQGRESEELRFSNVEPGQEVPNTSEDTSSFLFKGTLRFHDGQSLEAGYNRYDSEFGQVFPSSLFLYPPQQYPLNEVESNRYWLRYKWDSRSDLIGLQANVWHTNAKELGEFRENLPSSQENEAWGVEIWNTSFFDTGLGGLTLAYGAEYARSEAASGPFRGIVTRVFEGGGTPPRQVEGEEIVPDFEGDREVYGGYLNAAWQPTGWLTLDAGVRYDGFKADSTLKRGLAEEFDTSDWVELNRQFDDALARGDFQEFLRLLPLINLGSSHWVRGFTRELTESHESDGDAISPRVGVTVEPLDGLQLFAQYSEGFRALSFVELGQTGDGPVIVNPDLKPETVKTWEIGMNYLGDDILFDNDGIRAKLVYFNNDYDNFNLRTGGGIGNPGTGISPFFYENVPDVTVSGYEVGLSYDAGSVFADFNFNVFDETFPISVGPQSSIQQPEYAGTLTLGTRWFDERLELGGRLTFFGETPLDGPIESGVLFGPSQYYWDDQQIIDLFGSYELNDRLALGFSIENVMDRYYMPPLFVSRIPAPGRTFRVYFTARF